MQNLQQETQSFYSTCRDLNDERHYCVQSIQDIEICREGDGDKVLQISYQPEERDSIYRSWFRKIYNDAGNSLNISCYCHREIFFVLSLGQDIIELARNFWHECEQDSSHTDMTLLSSAKQIPFFLKTISSQKLRDIAYEIRKQKRQYGLNKLYVFDAHLLQQKNTEYAFKIISEIASELNISVVLFWQFPEK